jgi:hypothetical protein
LVQTLPENPKRASDQRVSLTHPFIPNSIIKKQLHIFVSLSATAFNNTQDQTRCQADAGPSD